METDGNILTTFALVAWAPFAIWTMRRHPAAKATAMLLLGAIMFLPEEVAYKWPGIPPFTKQEIAITWIVVAALVFCRDRLTNLRLPRATRVFFTMLFGGIALTILLNRDSLVFGPRIVEGHGPYDIVHQASTAAFLVAAPFILSAAIFRSSADLKTFVRLLVGATLIYSVFQLLELRFSPQFHRWVYGFHQHEFAQVMRKGGFRPMVFMSHGIAVAMFTMVGLVAAASLYKAKVKPFRVGMGWITTFLWGLLVVSKSTAALLYSILIVPLVLFVSPKNQVRAAFLLSIFFFSYPMIRSMGLVPVESIRAVALERFGEDRADSLMARFDNEDQLMVRARERPTFGWGSFCRACIFDEWDGEELSVRDGDWIIMLGDWGLVGFIGKFGLLWMPVWMLRRRLKFVPRQSDRKLLAGLALMVAISLVDLLPNGSFNYLHVVFSGVLLGTLLGIQKEAVVLRQKQRAKRVAAMQRGAHA